jgi:hypothetical protein
MPKSNKVKIWQSYQPVHDFYTKVDAAEVQRAKKLVTLFRYSITIARIRSAN